MRKQLENTCPEVENIRTFKNRNSFMGIFVPGPVLDLEGIGDGERILMGLILSLDGEDGCFASNQYFVNRLHKDCRSIQRYLSRLEEKGLICKTIDEESGRRKIRASSAVFGSHEMTKKEPHNGMVNSSPTHDRFVAKPMTELSPTHDRFVAKPMTDLPPIDIRLVERVEERVEERPPNPHPSASLRAGATASDKESQLEEKTDSAADPKVDPGKVTPQQNHLAFLSPKQHNTVVGRAGVLPKLLERILRIRLEKPPSTRNIRPNRPRAQVTAWNKIKHLVTEEEVTLMEKFYQSPKNKKTCDATWRRSLNPDTIMNNWTSQVEMAEEYMESQVTDVPGPIQRKIDLPDDWRQRLWKYATNGSFPEKGIARFKSIIDTADKDQFQADIEIVKELITKNEI